MVRELILFEIKNQNIQQKELAKKIRKLGFKITEAQLSTFLNGKAGLKIETIEAILKELGLVLIKPSLYEININNIINDNHDWTKNSK